MRRRESCAGSDQAIVTALSSGNTRSVQAQLLPRGLIFSSSALLTSFTRDGTSFNVAVNVPSSGDHGFVRSATPFRVSNAGRPAFFPSALRLSSTTLVIWALLQIDVKSPEIPSSLAFSMIALSSACTRQTQRSRESSAYAQ